MIFRLDQANYRMERQPASRLSDISWRENDLQTLLFSNLQKLLQDDALLLIMQSRKWQEEPDLMAIDPNGDLYIFEIKAWESQDANLLQALRYGQIFGQHDYTQLNKLYQVHFPGKPLLDVLNAKFSVSLSGEDINRKQHFVIITNGLDFRTRQSILYWRRKARLDVRPWIYRVYRVAGDVLIEFNAFESVDNPFSDIAEGCFIVNTNFSNCSEDHEDMLTHKKAAAYSDPWKYNIERLQRGSKVFLYQSGVGIVAYGLADGRVQKRNYHGNPADAEEEYFMQLTNFRRLETPMPARKIKEVTEVDYRFMATMFTIAEESAKRILEYLDKQP